MQKYTIAFSSKKNKSNDQKNLDKLKCWIKLSCIFFDII